MDYLFYASYLSIIVLFGSLNGFQLTDNVKKSFQLFGLTVLIVISLDVTDLILGSQYTLFRSILLYLEIFCMFIILFQLRKTKLSKVSICSYLFTLVCLSAYCIYSVLLTL